MKRILSLGLVLVLFCFSILALSGCKDSSDISKASAENYKEVYGFDAFVDKKAKIIGIWNEVIPENSKVEKILWRFEDTTTLNIVETVGEYSITTGCAYNFNHKTNELRYFTIDTKKETVVMVSFEGDSMTFSDENGNVIRSFTK